MFFADVKKSVFAKKKPKMMQFLGPKNGGPFLNLEPLAPVKFSVKMVRGTKNGAQKWDPKMVPQKMKNVGRSIEKLLRESCCIDMQSQPWIVYLAV